MNMNGRVINGHRLEVVRELRALFFLVLLLFKGTLTNIMTTLVYYPVWHEMPSPQRPSFPIIKRLRIVLPLRSVINALIALPKFFCIRN